MTIIQLKETMEAGTYNATLEKIETVNTMYGEALKFFYTTDDGQEASELVNMNYSKKSKLGKRAWSILREMPQTLDPNLLIGAKVVIELEDKPDSDFCKVVSVRKRQAVQQAVQTVSPAAAQTMPPQQTVMDDAPF